MPRKPLKPCTQPGCPELTQGGPCPTHLRERQQHADSLRPNSNARLYTSAWRRASKAFLLVNPLCTMRCKAEGRVTASTHTDHIIPHRGDPVLFWDPKNWQAGCDSCHSEKTAREDGGFGNRRVTA